MNPRSDHSQLAKIPWMLVGARIALGPIALLTACGSGPNWTIAIVIILAFLSDIYDGVLARRWHVCTDRLRRADSAADVIFYVCIVATIAIARPSLFMTWWPQITGIVTAEAICQTINYARFGRHTATHAYLCKFWSVLLCITSVAIFSIDDVVLLMDLTLIVGYLAYLDVLLIITLLPIPAVDIPSSLHAWRMRTRIRDPQLDSNGRLIDAELRIVH